MLESKADGNPYSYLKVLTTPCKIRAPFRAPFHNLTLKIPRKTMAEKKKDSRTNPVFIRLSSVLCDYIKYVIPFASAAKQYYFLFQWYFSEIYSIITPFLLIFVYPAILLITAVLTAYAAFLLIKKVKPYKWKASFPLATILFSIVLTIFFPFEKTKVYTEFLLYTPQREKIIETIFNDPSLADISGSSYKLPPGYRRLSCDGEAYIEKLNENETVIGFWVFRGLHFNGYSMVYYNSTQDEATLRQLIQDDIDTITQLNSKWFYVTTD